jgi:hypothetical protein
MMIDCQDYNNGIKIRNMVGDEDVLRIGCWLRFIMIDMSYANQQKEYISQHPVNFKHDVATPEFAQGQTEDQARNQGNDDDYSKEIGIQAIQEMKWGDKEPGFAHILIQIYTFPFVSLPANDSGKDHSTAHTGLQAELFRDLHIGKNAGKRGLHQKGI